MAKTPAPEAARDRAPSLPRAGQSRRQDRHRHRRHSGAWGGHRAAVRRARRGGNRDLRPQRGEGRAGCKRHHRGRLSDRVRASRSRQSRRLPQGRRRGGEALRARGRAGQRRRTERPGRHFRHDRGALQRDLRRQRARAVLPHSGDRADHAAAKDRGRHRQHTVHIGPWRAAIHRRLLRLEGGARDPHSQRCPFASSSFAFASMASTSAGCRRRARTAS